MANGPTQATGGFGVDVYVSDGLSPESFLLVDEVQSVTPPDLQLGTANATHMRSPGAFMEQVGTLLSGGDASFTVNVIPGSVASRRIYEVQLSRKATRFYITYPDGSGKAITFQGHITRNGDSHEQEGVFQNTITVKPTGIVEKVAWTPPST